MEPFPRPARDEAAEYYFTYIDQVPAGDIRAILEEQSANVQTLFAGIDEDRSSYRYGPDKWSIRQVLSHLTDTERVFAMRLLWFARGFEEPLPSFDQNIAMASARADERTWASHVDDFKAVRAATLTLVKNLGDDVWDRRGTASGYSFTVRAMAFIAAGHVAHHARILRERY